MVNRIETVTPERQAALGRLTLLMPTPNAKLEARDDGSLRITDALKPCELPAFWRALAKAVETNLAEAPACVTLRTSNMAEGDELRTPLPKGYGPKALATLIHGLTQIEPGSHVLSIGYDLACGCGVRVEVTRGA